jgi:DNA polymerase III epsilon subunit-like protein
MLADAEFVALDTETGGLEEGSEVLEVAALRFREGSIVDRYVTTVRPTRPIEVAASAVHGFHAEDLQDSPPRTVVDAWLADFIRSDDLVVAHNSGFDQEKIPVLADRRWLCTYRLAMHLWPTLPSHSLSTLASWLRLDLKMPGGGQSHRAEFDALTCGLLFHRQMVAFQGLRPYANLNDIVLRTALPIDVQIMKYGKYAGKAISELGSTYLDFVVLDAREPVEKRYFRSMDADTLRAIERELRMRRIRVA